MATHFCVVLEYGKPVSVHRFFLPHRNQENGYPHGRMYVTVQKVMESLLTKYGSPELVPRRLAMYSVFEYNLELHALLPQYVHQDIHDVFRSVRYNYIKRKFW